MSAADADQKVREDLGLTPPGRDIPVDRGVEPKIDGYNSQAAPVRPPMAAIFDKGATALPEVQDACDQRRAHSAALSDDHGRAGWEKQSPNS